MNERVVVVVNDVVLPYFNFNELIKRLSIQMMHRLKVVMQMMNYYYKQPFAIYVCILFSVIMHHFYIYI